RAVRDLIRQELGIDLAQRTVGQYLRRWGYTSKRPSRQARHQDPDEVEQWLLETYPAIEAQAEREGAEILWTDEVGVAADHHPGYRYALAEQRATREVPRRHDRVNEIWRLGELASFRFLTYDGALKATVV